jgi:hypothetical protein
LEGHGAHPSLRNIHFHHHHLQVSRVPIREKDEKDEKVRNNAINNAKICFLIFSPYDDIDALKFKCLNSYFED